MLGSRPIDDGNERGQRVRWAHRGVVAWLAAVVLAALVPAAAGAVEPQGALFSWGDNGSGQLGRSGAASPAAAALDQVVGLAAGRAHSISLHPDGTVRAWGSNVYGQLGTGGLSLSSNSPTAVGGVANVKRIAAGADHTLALTIDGQVWAWGNNASAQLGFDPNRVAFSRSPRRIDIPLSAGVSIIDLAAGDFFTVALASDGQVWGWGDNGRGQLGPALAAQGEPPRVTIFPSRVGVSGITAIGAGANHTLAVNSAGQVLAWGDNAGGQLSGGSGQADPLARTVALPAGAGPVKAVDGGRAHSVAVLADGRVVTWGDNSAGQLGRVAGNAPDFVAGLARIASANARTDTTVAVEANPTTARVLTWGANGSSQLGHAPQLGHVPAAVSIGDTAIAAAAGDNHTLAAVAARTTLNTSAVTFGGIVEVGTTTPAETITLANNGPGALRIGAVAFQDGQTDFAFAPNGDTCSNTSLAAGGSCAIKVVFAPVAAGPRNSYLVVDHDGYGGDPRIDLHGQGVVLSGGLSITTATDHLTDGVPASPSAVPVGNIPLQPQSPAAKDAEATGSLGLGDLTGIGSLGLGDLTGISSLGLGDLTGIGSLGLGDLTGIGSLGLGDLTGISSLGLGDLTGIGDPVRSFLGEITLASLPLANGSAWDAVLAGTPLVGRPLQDITLLDVLSDPTAAARFRAVPVRNVGWVASRLGGMGLLSFLLGNTPLAAIAGHDWCAQLQAAGRPDCGAGFGRAATPADGRSASALEHDLSGIGLGGLNLAAVRLGQIGNRAAPVFQLLLDRVDLYRSDLGSLKLSALPNREAVVDCAKADCADPNATLATAQGARGIKATATLGDLGAAVADTSMGRLAAGLLDLDADSYGTIELERLGINGYAGNDGVDSHKFPYTVTFANTSGNALPAGTTISVRLPDTFVYVPGSSTMKVQGANTAVPVTNPTVDNHLFTWQVPTDRLTVPNGATLVLDFAARPGMKLGTFTVNEVAVATPTKTVRTTTPSAPVRVVDGLEDNDSPATATPIDPTAGDQSGELKVSHIDSAGDRDYFAFNAAGIAPGSQIAVHLDHQVAGDADLVLYGAPGMKGEAPLRAVPANATTLTPLPELLPPINGAGLSLQSDVQHDVHREATLPLLGISQNRDTTDEIVVAPALTPASGGDRYVIEVSGYNGAFADTAYTLRVNITPPAPTLTAPARTFPFPADPTFTAAAPTASPFTGATTLFITAPGRMQRLFGTAAATSVNNALKDTRLAGIIGRYGVLNVDGDPTVRTAFAAWDANPADAAKANDVVRAVNALADRLVPTASIQNVVVVGNDSVIPFGRITDLTSTVSERLYARELAVRTSAADPLVGAAASGRFLSDDAYADADPSPMAGAQFLYLPSAALGRLVDTPAQITAVLNQFMQFNGVVDPKTSLTTSAADFLDDAAAAIDAALANKGVTRSTLTTENWDKAALVSAWTNKAPGIVAFNGHSDPSLTGTRADQTGAGGFTTADLGTAQLNGEIVVTVGCHTGLPVADGVLRLPSAQSWSSALLSRGAAAYAGQTGYGLGSRSTVAFTEKISLGFAKALGTSSVGQSLVTAKQQYLIEGGPADVLDAKALMQATFFGMPHLRLATSTAPPQAPALATGTDPITGLDAAFITKQSLNPTAPGHFAFQKHVTQDGTFYSVDGRTLTVAGRPVQPLITQDVTRPGLRAHGVAFTGLRSTDEDGTSFDPVLPRPVAAGIGTPEDELQAGNVAFPSALQSVRSANGKDSAVIVPALFQSTGMVGGKTVGHERRFTELQATVLYAPASNTDFTPPTILSSRAVTTTSGDAVTFVVDASDAVDVTVLLKEEGKDTWRLVRLAKTGSAWSGGALVTGTKVEYFVQAVDGSGNVAVMGNKGRLLKAEPLDARTGSVIVDIAGTPTPANPTADPKGWFRTARVALASTDPSVIVTARVDGGVSKPVSVVQFAGDGVANPAPGAVIGDGHHVVSYTASDGSSGVIVVRLDNAGPQITVKNPAADGSSFFVVGSVATASYRCGDAASGLAVNGCTASINGAPVADGGRLPTDIRPDHSLVVTSRDLAGNTSTSTVSYQVGYRFDGFFEPVQNRPNVNLWSAGQTVPMKWRLYDANNTPVTATSTFVGAGSFEFACSSVPPPGTTPGSGTGTQSGFNQTGDTFQYGWSTEKAWKGTCRRFVLRLDDGTLHLADFRFQ